MKTEKMVSKITNDSTVKYFTELMGDRYSGLLLVGGAVVDILEGRTPLDYDFVAASDADIDIFKCNGFKFVSVTKSAITLKKQKIVVQFLTRSLVEFDFKISQSTYNFRTKKLTIDLISFEEKTLIPTSFINEEYAIRSLVRIPHWRKKGYDIKDVTYLSLLNVIGTSKRIESTKS